MSAFNSAMKSHSAFRSQVVDKDLKDWILPKFSTTTDNDTVICAVLMMSTLKAYFDYKMSLMCGIPSVTLEGEKSDWEALLSRINKLPTFGAEPGAWEKILRPILSRFVGAFDLAEKNAPQDIDFWNRICSYHPQGSGPTYLSGWITAFCVWSNEGKWMGPVLPGQQEPSRWMPMPVEKLVLDDAEYNVIDSDEVPNGFCEVDVKLDDNGEELECMMVSGHLASRVEGLKKDTLRPLPSWFMFVKEQCETPRTRYM